MYRRAVYKVLIAAITFSFWALFSWKTGLTSLVRITVGEGEKNEYFRISFLVMSAVFLLTIALFRGTYELTGCRRIWKRLIADVLLGSSAGYMASLGAYALMLVALKSHLDLAWIAKSPADIFWIAVLLAAKLLWLSGAALVLTYDLLRSFLGRNVHC
jgi:hypothetical protein